MFVGEKVKNEESIKNIKKMEADWSKESVFFFYQNKSDIFPHNRTKSKI